MAGRDSDITGEMDSLQSAGVVFRSLRSLQRETSQPGSRCVCVKAIVVLQRIPRVFGKEFWLL
jgi:hypothetical protein